MNKKIFILKIMVFCAFSMLYGEIIFEDTFESGDNWVGIPGVTNFTDNAENGYYIVECNNTNLSLLKHNKTVENFTCSIKMEIQTANDNGCGILFCLQSDLQGYSFTVYAGKQYSIGKWLKSGETYSYSTINIGWNSFINESDNTLKVSKNGNEISLFCNDVFLEKITDDTFGSGDIGLSIGKSETVAFDHALLTDELDPGTPKVSYTDSFENSDFKGWRIFKGDGIVQEEDGVMKIAPEAEDAIVYTNGSYKDRPCTTIITYKEGGEDTFYGLVFLKIDITPADGGGFTISYNGYHYLINSNRSYTVFQTSGTTNVNSNIHGTTDTLIITTNNEFIINGEIVDNTTFTESMDFNAIGFFVNAGVSVEFDYFSAGDVTVPIVFRQNKAPVSNLRNVYILGGSGIIYDTKGRQVASFDGTYNDQLKNLSSGPYYILTKGKKNHLIRHAVINVR